VLVLSEGPRREARKQREGATRASLQFGCSVLVLLAACGSKGKATDVESRPTADSVPPGTTVSRLRQPVDSSYTEFVAVLLSASWCAACRQPTFPEAVAHALSEARKGATAAGGEFRTIGVVMDEDLDSAFQGLKHYGEFDEAVLGGSWEGLGATLFVWRDIAGQPTVPQMLLLRREVKLVGGFIDIGQDELLARLVGEVEMRSATVTRLRMQ
jgi:hypothetical protein